MMFMETSALEGNNIDEAFKSMIACTIYPYFRDSEPTEIARQ